MEVGFFSSAAFLLPKRMRSSLVPVITRQEKLLPPIRDTCRKGIFVGYGGVKGNVIRLQPPLVMSTEELDQAISVLSEALEDAERKAT